MIFFFFFDKAEDISLGSHVDGIPTEINKGLSANTLSLDIHLFIKKNTRGVFAQYSI